MKNLKRLLKAIVALPLITILLVILMTIHGAVVFYCDTYRGMLAAFMCEGEIACQIEKETIYQYSMRQEGYYK